LNRLPGTKYLNPSKLGALLWCSVHQGYLKHPQMLYLNGQVFDACPQCFWEEVKRDQILDAEPRKKQLCYLPACTKDSTAHCWRCKEPICVRHARADEERTACTNCLITVKAVAGRGNPDWTCSGGTDCTRRASVKCRGCKCWYCLFHMSEANPNICMYCIGAA
jgi:hypothetical protein